MQRRPGSTIGENEDAGFIFQNAQGILIELDAAITTQAGGLEILPKHGDVGFFGAVKYENWNGTIYKSTYTSV